MLTDKDSTVSLRIFSKILTCEEISKFLGWEPSEKYEKGSFFGGKDNKCLREEALWIYKLEIDEKTSYIEQLEKLVNLIYNKKEFFYKIQDDSEFDIFSSYTTYNGQGGFSLKSDLMYKLGTLNIDLSVDYYSLVKE